MITKHKILQAINKGLANTMITNVIIVGIVTLFVKALGFAKEVVIADSFGLSELLDTFYIAVLIPGFMSNVFLDGFKSVFIPNYVYEQQTGKPMGSFQSTCFLVTLGVSIFFCLIAILGTDTYLEVFFKGHTPGYYALVKMQFYIIIPAIIFWGFSSLLTGLLTIDGEFLFSSMGPIFIAIAMIVCVVFFKDELENIVLASGMLIGSLANFLFLLIVSLKRKILFIAKPDFISENVKVLFKQLPAKIASNLLTGANEVVDQYFAATLVVGSIAALNYGIKIPMFTIGIVTMALGNVLLPYFSKKVSENRKKAFDELRKILRFVIIGGSIIAILLMLVTSPLVSLIFERNAFTSSDTTIVSRIQQMYLLQIPAYIATILMVRFLESINKNSFMVLAAIVNLSLNILLNYLLIKSMGVFGLALATSIVAIVDGLVLYLYINHLNKLNV